MYNESRQITTNAEPMLVDQRFSAVSNRKPFASQ